MHPIEIAVPFGEIENRRARVEKTRQFQTPDRIPVIPAIAHRFLIPQVHVSFRDYYNDAETMLRTQILAQKWLMENIRTDAYSITGPWTGAWTDFQNTFEAGSLGCAVVFPNDDIPWVDKPWVKNEQDLRRLEEIDFIDSGINARQVAYRRIMMDVAEKYPVRFQGGPITYPGRTPALTRTCDGPFGIAGDLMEKSELFTAICERPDFVKELLRIITDKMIDYLDFCASEERLTPPIDFAWSDDLAASLSADTYNDIVLPFDRRLRFHFDGRIQFHMCGKTDHLLPLFVNDLEIDEFIGFGYQVDLDQLAEVMGGRVVLMGNVSPLLIRYGTPQEVREATRTVIERLGRYNGLIIQDGSNIPPGSPLENINAMMEASELYGRNYDVEATPARGT